jgi:hypothetical protein
MILLAAALWAHSQTPLPAVPEKTARQMLSSMRAAGTVGGADFRVTATDHSYNYKLRATWITPEVAGAAGRLLTIVRGLDEKPASAAAAVAAKPESWFVLVELDPREGSGVIPNEWVARFGPKGEPEHQIVGHPIAIEGDWKTLLGAFPRDYAYDIFVVEFPRKHSDGSAVLPPGTGEAELSVRIYNKQGRAHWQIPVRLLP